MKIKQSVIAMLFSVSCCTLHAATLQPLTNQPPQTVGLAILLTDGSVMFQGSSYFDWWKLTPDSTGHYLDGTWTQLARIPPAWNYGPFAFASAVLADGRVLIEGGEGNLDNPFSLTSQGAIYDPVTNTWAQVQPPRGWSFIGDATSIVMPNGKFLLGDKLTTRIAELDPTTLTWTALGSGGKSGVNAEEGWTLLPDGSYLAVDVSNAPKTERYFYSDMPGAGQWTNQGPTPQSLAWNYNLAPIAYAGGTYVPPGETGPCILRPDGTVFCAGASDDKPANRAHTAIYSPATMAWASGPDFPPGDDAGDTSAVLLPSGHVLISATSGTSYEFDGTQLTPGPFVGPASLLLTLPDGEALVSGKAVEVYTPSVGVGPDPSWAPTIGQWPSTILIGSSNHISGTQFNGLSQAQAFGDEIQAPTNYPLVRITNSATGHVFYARTHDHSSMGVATGATPVSTNFDVPRGIEKGASTLTVVANGIPSAPVNVLVASSPVTMDGYMSGNWYDVAQSGQGFQLEMAKGNTMVAIWFTFAPDGSGQNWIYAQGSYDNTKNTVSLPAVILAGAKFPPNFNPSSVTNKSWGTITFTFSDCNTGTASWSSILPGYGSGSMPISRLTQIEGTTCP